MSGAVEDEGFRVEGFKDLGFQGQGFRVWGLFPKP